MHFLKVKADLVTGFRTGTTVLAVFLNTGFTDILFMGAGLTMQARIVCSLLFDLEVSFDFLSDRRRISFPRISPIALNERRSAKYDCIINRSS